MNTVITVKDDEPSMALWLVEHNYKFVPFSFGDSVIFSIEDIEPEMAAYAELRWG